MQMNHAVDPCCFTKDIKQLTSHSFPGCHAPFTATQALTWKAPSSPEDCNTQEFQITHQCEDSVTVGFCKFLAGSLMMLQYYLKTTWCGAVEQKFFGTCFDQASVMLEDLMVRCNRAEILWHVHS